MPFWGRGPSSGIFESRGLNQLPCTRPPEHIRKIIKARGSAHLHEHSADQG